MPKKRKRKTATEKPVVVPELEPTGKKPSGVMGLLDTDATDEELDAFVDQFNAMVEARTSPEDSQ
ncbi:MAG: hypothetical protein ABGZ17_06820 [Planctomycetaceae bacterium]